MKQANPCECCNNYPAYTKDTSKCDICSHNPNLKDHWDPIKPSKSTDLTWREAYEAYHAGWKIKRLKTNIEYNFYGANLFSTSDINAKDYYIVGKRDYYYV